MKGEERTSCNIISTLLTSGIRARKTMRISTYCTKLLLLSLLCFVLVGCATLNRDECLTADWQAIGYEDGVVGRTAGYLGNHRKACAEYGVSPDLEEYLAGHSRGIALYCRPLNGYRLGIRGHSYGGECPAELEKAFLSAHTDGYGLFTRQRKVDRLRDDLDRAEDELATNRQAIFEKRSALTDPETTRKQRLALLVELDNLMIERTRIRRVIWQTDTELKRAVQEYENYRDSLPVR